MNLKNLGENYPKLISYMENSGYSKIYVGTIVKEIKRILKKTEIKGWTSYKDVYMDYIKKGCSKSYLCNERNIIGVIEQFDDNGRYPDGRNRHELTEKSYEKLRGEFKAIIDCYCETERKRGKKESNIYTKSNEATTFMLNMQQRGVERLEQITEEDVLSVFLSASGELIRSYGYKKGVAAVFKAYAPYYPEACGKVLSFLPALKERRKNIQYLTAEEIKKIKEALNNNEKTTSFALTLRDKAMGVLALYTGLRNCDIAGMKVNDIDWDKDIIYILQQKTGVPLELPLTARVGNAVYDYIVYERGQTECEYLFISRSRPYGKLNDRSIRNTAIRIMKAAGIRESKGDRKGFHLFRHHIATALLGNGVPQPVVSEVLGHTSPNSLEAYLSADFVHLKECSLSIERFPVAEGVFAHE